MNYIGPKAVLLGECASVDEMTIDFQGSHKDKRRITYKAEEDGFQCGSFDDIIRMFTKLMDIGPDFG
jgi:hypothetical protein